MQQILRDKYISKPRFNRYLYAIGNDPERAYKLYHENILLSQAFHPLLSQFEVILRNSLNYAFSIHFNNSDWIFIEKKGFMSDPVLERSQFYILKCVEAAEHKLTTKKLPVTSAKIVADQTFGFWTAFFEPWHYRLVHGQPIQIFPDKPVSENRASIHNKLETLRRFRNRVNHCEPLCFRGEKIDCINVTSIRSTLFDLISWIDPELIPFFSKFDSTQERIAQIMNL